MTHKNRNQKEIEYSNKYGDIPIDTRDRIEYLYDKLHITGTEAYNIMQMSANMLGQLKYSDIMIVLFEIPEGSPRPRFRLINRNNFTDAAISNSQFVHVYSITGAEDNKYMKRLISNGEIQSLNSMINTPCNIDISAYLPTPSAYNKYDTILAEMGIIRPITKPDFDNIAKKYCDMFNSNIWLDDALVIDGYTHKYYSILPRVEIKISYLNMVYNKYQYNSLYNKCDSNLSYFNNKE